MRCPPPEPRDYLTIARGERTTETDAIFELHAHAFARVVETLRLWDELAVQEKAYDKAHLHSSTPGVEGALDKTVH